MASKSGFEEGEVTDQFIKEEIERRKAPRGLFPGLTIRLADSAGVPRTLDVVEASRKSMFLSTDTPGTYTLRQILEAEIAYKDRRVQCKVQIARAESAPRKGIVIVVHETTPAAEIALHEVLEEAEVTTDD